MNEFIDTLVTDAINPNLIIPWLNKDIVIPSLLKVESLRNDFVPTFLNFLRDQTSSYLHSGSHTGLTPNKSSIYFTKYVSPSKITRKPNRSTKAKNLDFSKTPNSYNGKKFSSHKNTSPDLIRNKDLDESFNTPHKSPVYVTPLSPNPSSPFDNSFKIYSTSTPRHLNPFQPDFSRGSKHFSLEEDMKVSERKSVLADYIVPEKKSHKKKNMTIKESLQEWSQVSHSVNQGSKIDFNISDTDAFPPMGGEVKNRTKQRRINPTPVKPSPSNDNVIIKSPFGAPRSQCQQNAFLVAQESKPNSIETERQILREAKERLQKSASLSHSSSVVSSSKFGSKIIGKKNFTPSLNDVTSQKELDALSQVYSELMMHNKVPNIMVELYFILQLLTLDTSFNEDSFLSDSQSLVSYLNSFPNCIYFSVKTLSLIGDSFYFFEQGFVKSLSENPRIYAFDPDFKNKLLLLLNSDDFFKSHYKVPKSPILSVAFQSDTDNKNNFPTTGAFLVFKKQRDDFYEVLRIWQNRHMEPKWSFELCVGARVRQLLALRQDSVNVAHFARLFQSQLVAMCKGNEQFSNSFETGDNFLTELERQNPERLNKLFGRLIAPSKIGGPVPLPSFPGFQEFFKDFILAAENHAFNVYLRDVLLTNILQLNASLRNVVEEEEELNEDLYREKTWSTLQILRLLAKFLGFVEFLPYRSSEYLPDTVIATQIHLRNQNQPPVCFSEILRKGASSGSLIIVVTWLVEFLSMVDQAAFHTQYYATLMFELIFIYKLLYAFRLVPESLLCNTCDRGTFVSTSNSLFLKLTIGWLLSLPNIPDGLFYATEDEIEIDHSEFNKTTKVIRSCYSTYCSECLKLLVYVSKTGNVKSNETCSQLLQDMSSITFEESSAESKSTEEFASPAKETHVFRTPLKKNKYARKKQEKYDSPLKTPSKFLQVGMLNTPDNTPDKMGSNMENEYPTKKFNLDSWQFVDHQIMMTCCPFFNELKGILSDFSFGTSKANSSGSVRKITPLSASEKTTETPAKALQLQLEDNFFHNQPTSVKKTVEFVVERIHSNVVRSIRSSIIPQLKDDCLERLKCCVSNSMLNSPSLDKVNETTEKKIQNLSHDLSLEIREKALAKMENLIAQDNVRLCLKFLFPDEVSEKSLLISMGVVFRLVKERVMSWMTSHLNSNFCTQELTTEARKFIKNTQKSSANDTGHSEASFSNGSLVSAGHVSGLLNNSVLAEEPFDNSANGHLGPLFKNSNVEIESKLEAVPEFKNAHDEKAISPSMMLCKVKVELRRMILFCENGISDPRIDALITLKEVKQTVLGRRDMTAQVYKALEVLTVDYMTILCIYKPKLVNKEIVEMFCSFWGPLEHGGIFKIVSSVNILTPRALKLLSKTDKSKQKIVWQKIEMVLMELVVKRRYLAPGKLQEMAVSLLQYMWPQTVLDGVSGLVRNLCNQLGNKGADIEDVESTELLEWVGWASSQMEDYE